MDDCSLTLQYVANLVKRLNEECFDAVWNISWDQKSAMTDEQTTWEEFGVDPFSLVVICLDNFEYAIKFLEVTIWQSAGDERDMVAYGNEERFTPLRLLLLQRASRLLNLFHLFRYPVETSLSVEEREWTEELEIANKHKEATA